jgi:hypothetical protein
MQLKVQWHEMSNVAASSMRHLDWPVPCSCCWAFEICSLLCWLSHCHAGWQKLPAHTLLVKQQYGAAGSHPGCWPLPSHNSSTQRHPSGSIRLAAGASLQPLGSRQRHPCPYAACERIGAHVGAAADQNHDQRDFGPQHPRFGPHTAASDCSGYGIFCDVSGPGDGCESAERDPANRNASVAGTGAGEFGARWVGGAEVFGVGKGSLQDAAACTVIV